MNNANAPTILPAILENASSVPAAHLADTPYKLHRCDADAPPNRPSCIRDNAHEDFCLFAVPA